MRYTVEVVEHEFGYDPESIDYHGFLDFENAKDYALRVMKDIQKRKNDNSKYDIYILSDTDSWWVMKGNRVGIDIYKYFGDGTKIIYPSGAMSEKDELRLTKNTLIEGKIIKKGTVVRVVEADKPETATLLYPKGEKMKIYNDEFPILRVSNQTIKVSMYDLSQTRNPNIGPFEARFRDKYGHTYVSSNYPPSDGYYYYELF